MVPWSLCSLVMCLLKWKQVIEWDNLRTQGLGLLLATIFSEEWWFQSLSAESFPQSQYTDTNMCTEIFEPILEAKHIFTHLHSSTATANLPSNRQQVLNRAFGTKRNDYFLYKLNKREPNSHPLFAPSGSCLLI